MLQSRYRSKSLYDTKLWKEYKKKIDKANLTKRSIIIESVYESATALLKRVSDTFGNYTLHDETHVLNVLDAMAGILGKYTSSLNIDELELLMFSASLHDIGMVFYVGNGKNEKEAAFSNEEWVHQFIMSNPDYSEYCKTPLSKCPPNIQQNFLRSIHQLRVEEVIDNHLAKEFDNWPTDMLEKEIIVAVCQAHGENIDDLINNPLLRYDDRYDIQPLFCASLLRLADLLDYDDTRTPQVLHQYAIDDEKSLEEWNKHHASAGFNYSRRPSTDNLPLVATCKNVAIANSVYKFLDWIDAELDNCRDLQKFYIKDSQREFAFPYKVSRIGIKTPNFTKGSFSLTLNENQVLNLFSGNALYGRNDVFIRELLQNAVDATLLRAEQEPSFSLDNTNIEMWEWIDNNGDDWFRIDDNGTGMTLGMIKRYFLNVGSSYYTSKEIKQDLYRHNSSIKFNSIAQFGIGFLSCFLCGDIAEISTLYFDKEKNNIENNANGNAKYGIRFEMQNGEKYYTLRQQSKKHKCPCTLRSHPKAKESSEYRETPGTSILIKLNRGKLGPINLRETVKEFVMGTQMPIYFNGERVGKTINEIKHLCVSDNYEYVPSPYNMKFFSEYTDKTKLPSPFFSSNITCSSIENDQCFLVCEKQFLNFPEANTIKHNPLDIYKDGNNFTVRYGINDMSTSIGHFHAPDTLFSCDDKYFFHIYYNGILQTRLVSIEAFRNTKFHRSDDPLKASWGTFGSIFLTKDKKPTVDVSRSKVLALPLEVVMFINYTIYKHFSKTSFWDSLEDLSVSDIPLSEWRTFLNSEYGENLLGMLKNELDSLKENLYLFCGSRSFSFSDNYNTPDSSKENIYQFLIAYLQLNYEMAVDFANPSGELVFYEKKADTTFDAFPLMYFFKSKDKENKQCICSYDSWGHRFINADSSFVQWLVANQKHLCTYYRQEYNALIDALRYEDANKIVNCIENLLNALKQFERTNMNYDLLGDISINNFWHV